MKYLIIVTLLLAGCVSQQEARDQQADSARRYCRNTAEGMFSIPDLAQERAQEYVNCLNRLGVAP